MSRSKRKRKNNNQADLQIDPVLAEVIENFAGCGRCSYFWAGYRVIVGEAGAETAAKGDDPNWLILVWSHRMRDLTFKSYGLRFDVEYFHHAGCCPECQRQFVYDEDEPEEPSELAESQPESGDSSELAEPIEVQLELSEDLLESGERDEQFELANVQYATFKIGRMPAI